MIRPCTPIDFDTIYEIVSDAAMAYKGVIPDDRWHDPYMPKAELRAAFTMWGFWEGRMWQPPGAMITLKPNGQAWMDLTLKEWWTDVTMTTGADGSCTTRGFLGDYRVTAIAGGKEKSVLLSLAKPANTTVLAVD